MTKTQPNRLHPDPEIAKVVLCCASTNMFKLAIAAKIQCDYRTLVKHYSSEMLQGYAHFNEVMNAAWMKAALNGSVRLLGQFAARQYSMEDKARGEPSKAPIEPLKIETYTQEQLTHNTEDE